MIRSPSARSALRPGYGGAFAPLITGPWGAVPGAARVRLWLPGKPDLELARKSAEAIKRDYPDKMLACNCSPSFNWKKNLGDTIVAKYQRELGSMGYGFQFIPLAGFHAPNYAMFELVRRGEGASA
ncbi:hypothetical protein J2T57_001416 [Natronocella acetinitrilica]|uniref:Isocitrate lyase n=1 Tax=Natronocella acetinitrilica TaxID=414046 RepID=A0AAE3KB32_9GAMM|nr:hypothetical protein [Natronocella acetinitrilica]